MTEKEKMLNGLMYDPSNKELDQGRKRARLLIRKLNEIPDEKERQRKHVFKELFAETGQKFLIENPFICDYGYNIYWGENSYANFGCVILDSAPVRIGKNVMLAPSVQILTATHPLEAAVRNAGQEFAKPITIGDNVWIGGGAIINPGVTIGNNSVIGSGSVVTKDMPANVVAAGNPCRVIKEIDNG
jgi:maltose O-acetyltransferase